MKQNRPSSTAEMAAFARALHLRVDRPPVFEDRLAVRLISPPWRALVRIPPLRWYADRVLLRGLRSFRAALQLRSRYAEDRLEQAMGRGISQYVILGAGLDSFAWRRPDLSQALRVFELDHPATQAWKRSRLASAGLHLLPQVEFVPIDFDRQTVEGALRATGYHFDRPAFYIWVGITYYLTLPALQGTLRSIGSFAAPGSELVFDYLVPLVQSSTTDRKRLALTQRITRRRGEPTQLLLVPEDLKREVEIAGLEIVEDLSASEMDDRYLAGRADGLGVYPGYRYLTARRGS